MRRAKIFIFFISLLFLFAEQAYPEKRYLSSGAHWEFIEKNLCEKPDKIVNQRIKIERKQYGKSAHRRPLWAYIVHPRPDTVPDAVKNIYLIAAQHGDEQNTTRVLEYFLQDMQPLSRSWLSRHRVILIPLYNPDGYKKNSRLAKDDIDLNRDFVTSDAPAENPKAPETHAFLKLLETYPANMIYNFHQPFRVVLHEPEDEEVAKPFAIISDYPLGQGVGYPTPGSLGTYGRENKIPVITVELARSMKKLMAPFIYEEVRLALFHAAFGCIPKTALKSTLEKRVSD